MAERARSRRCPGLGGGRGARGRVGAACGVRSRRRGVAGGAQVAVEQRRAGWRGRVTARGVRSRRRKGLGGAGSRVSRRSRAGRRGVAGGAHVAGRERQGGAQGGGAQVAAARGWRGRVAAARRWLGRVAWDRVRLRSFWARLVMWAGFFWDNLPRELRSWHSGKIVFLVFFCPNFFLMPSHIISNFLFKFGDI